MWQRKGRKMLARKVRVLYEVHLQSLARTQSPQTPLLIVASWPRADSINASRTMRMGAKCHSAEPRLQVDDSAPHGDRHCLGTIIGAQLAHDVLHVNFNGFHCNEKLLCDVLIAVTVSDAS